MANYLFTSESVTGGHPDKICDQISDAVLDAILAQDPMGRVACETCTTTGMVMIMGEITTSANIDIPAIARKPQKKSPAPTRSGRFQTELPGKSFVAIVKVIVIRRKIVRFFNNNLLPPFCGI